MKLYIPALALEFPDFGVGVFRREAAIFVLAMLISSPEIRIRNGCQFSLKHKSQWKEN